MPQLRSQRGSLLVTVLGISIVMSMSAAGLLLVTGNSLADEDLILARQQRFNDAESGLLVGAAWLKNSPGATSLITTNQGWPGGTLQIFGNVAFENGSSVTVTLTDNAPAQPTKTVTAVAVLGGVTSQYSWDVGVAVDNGPTIPPILQLNGFRTP